MGFDCRNNNIRVKVNSSVGKLAELSSLLELGGLLSVLRIQSQSHIPQSNILSIAEIIINGGIK